MRTRQCVDSSSQTSITEGTTTPNHLTNDMPRSIHDRLFLRFLSAGPLVFLLAWHLHADPLVAGCKLAVDGKLEEALVLLKQADAVLNAPLKPASKDDFQELSAAVTAQTLRFLVEDAKQARFSEEDCRLTAQAILDMAQGKSRNAREMFAAMVIRHFDNPMIRVLAARGGIRVLSERSIAVTPELFTWYDVREEALHNLFNSIDNPERKSLGAYFLIDYATYQWSVAGGLHGQEGNRSKSMTARMHAFDNFHAATGFAHTDRIRAICHYNALEVGKVLSDTMDFRYANFLAGFMVTSRSQLEEVLDAHRSGLKAMGVKFPWNERFPNLVIFLAVLACIAVIAIFVVLFELAKAALGRLRR
jgi:hypothetical protein